MDQLGNIYIGEHNSNDEPFGKGLKIFPHGVTIGFWNNEGLAVGNYIRIYPDGDFDVGECYEDPNTEFELIEDKGF